MTVSSTAHPARHGELVRDVQMRHPDRCKPGQRDGDREQEEQLVEHDLGPPEQRGRMLRPVLLLAGVEVDHADPHQGPILGPRQAPLGDLPGTCPVRIALSRLSCRWVVLGPSHTQPSGTAIGHAVGEGTPSRGQETMWSSALSLDRGLVHTKSPVGPEALCRYTDSEEKAWGGCDKMSKGLESPTTKVYLDCIMRDWML